LPIDPVQRIRYQPSGNLSVQISEEGGRNLHLSHYPTLNIDGQVFNPFNPQGFRLEVNNAPLSKTPGGRDRKGFMSAGVQGDMRITLTAEVVPTKPAAQAQKRRLDSVLVRYLLENKGKQSHKVGLRAYIDTYIIDNDGALF